MSADGSDGRAGTVDTGPTAPGAAVGHRGGGVAERTFPQLTSRHLLALVALLAGLMMITASFSVWLTLPDGAGGTTTISGWGIVSGGSQISGQNINDAMTGFATFRPGPIPLIFGVLAVLSAAAVAVMARGERPHRIPAAVMALCGVVAVGFGLLRLNTPDPAAILEDGEGGAGVGPWLTLGGGVALIAAAVVVFAGGLDPSPRVPQFGVQPR